MGIERREGRGDQTITEGIHGVVLEFGTCDGEVIGVVSRGPLRREGGGGGGGGGDRAIAED